MTEKTPASSGQADTCSARTTESGCEFGASCGTIFPVAGHGEKSKKFHGTGSPTKENGTPYTDGCMGDDKGGVGVDVCDDDAVGVICVLCLHTEKVWRVIDPLTDHEMLGFVPGRSAKEYYEHAEQLLSESTDARVRPPRSSISSRNFHLNILAQTAI